MGKTVRVDVGTAVQLPSDYGTTLYLNGQSTTLRDSEYTALPQATKDKLTITNASATDPVRPTHGAGGGGTGAVSSVNTQTGAVVLGATDVGAQPVDADLSAIAALATTTFGRSVLALADAAALRSAAALGTAATQASSAFEASDADLDAIAALSTSSFGRGLLALADAAALRTAAGLGTAATQASTAFQAADSDLTAIAALTTTSFGRGLLADANAASIGIKSNDLADWLFPAPPINVTVPPYRAMAAGNNTAFVVGSSGKQSFCEIVIPRGGLTFDRVRMSTSVAQVGGSTTCKLAVYGAASDGSPDVASGPLASGTVDLTAAAGTLFASISWSPPKIGLYYLSCVYVEGSAPTTRATASTVGNAAPSLYGASGYTPGQSPGRGWVLTGQTDLATSGTPVPSNSSDILYLDLRRSA